MASWRHRPGRGAALVPLALALVLAVVAPACAGDGSAATTEAVPLEIGGDAYVTVIARFLPPSLVDDVRPVVYVVPVSGESLPLDTQVSVIESLAETYDVRFLDDPAAAVEDDAAEQPPRDEATLIGLGTISGEPPHTVRVELYRGRDRVSGHLLTLRNEGGAWVVSDTETVTPEVLVGDG